MLDKTNQRGKRWGANVAITVALCIILLVTLGLGCTTKATPSSGASGSTVTVTTTAKPTATPTVTVTTAATTTQKVIELKGSTSSGEVGRATDAVRWYLKEIEARSGGKVKFTMYYSSTLIPLGSEIEMLGKGTADLSFIQYANELQRIPLTSVVMLPGLIKESRVGGSAMNELAQMDVIKAEFDKNNLVFGSAVFSEPYYPATTSIISKLTDIKKLTLWASGDQAKLAGKLGWATAALSTAETHDALIKGTLGGGIWPRNVFSKPAWGAIDAIKCFYLIEFGSPAWGIAWNKDTFNALPADVQKVITDPELNKLLPLVYDAVAGCEGTYDARVIVDKAGLKLAAVEPTPEDAATVTKAAGELRDEWLKNIAAKGLPAQQVYDKWTQLAKKWDAFYKRELW